MKSFCLFLLLGISFLISSGFKEVTRIIKVSRDGSGVIHVRVMFNPRMLDKDAKVFDQEKLKAAAGKYGRGVRYVAGKKITHGTTNWKGYIAKYSFYDVTKLQVHPASIPEDLNEEEMEDEVAGWRFAFTKSETEEEPSVLKIIPTHVDTGDDDDDDGWEDDDDDDNDKKAADDDDDDGGWGDDDDDDDDDDGKKAADDDDDDAAADDADDLEMKQKQRGRRYVTYIQVLGAISATKPAAEKLKKFLSAKRKKNTITINDEQWEVMWKNKEARKLMKMTSPNMAPLIGQDIPGFRSLDRKVTVKFQ